MTTVTDQNLIDHFRLRQHQLPDYDLPWLRETRRRGLERFQQQGFPGLAKGRRREHWKYTDTRAIAETRYWQTAPKAGRIEEQLAHFILFEQPFNRLVFVNGNYVPGLSRLPDLAEQRQAGLVIESLTDTLISKPALISDYLNALADDENFPFAALNTGLLEHGAVIYVPEGVELNQPVHVLFISTPPGGTSESFNVNPRLLVVAEANSRFDLIEHHGSVMSEPEQQDAGDNRALSNCVTEIVLHDGAHCRYTRIHQENSRQVNLGATYVQQDRNSTFESYTVCLGGALLRNDLNVQLAGEGAQCALQGLYTLQGHEHADNHTCIDHLAVRCSSREYYKGLIDDQAHAVFNGRIHIHPGAQKTDAMLQNKNLLLSAQAEVDTKPELEIYADDVRCAHGATVGELSNEQIHYLESRCIDRQTARSMLSLAFANEIIETLPYDELRRGVYDHVAQRMMEKTKEQ